MTEEHKACDRMFAFFLNELTPEEAEVFKFHLTSCKECRDELEELRQVWQSLPYEMDDIEVPELLKEQMFDNLLLEIEEKPNAAEEAVTAEAAEKQAETQVKPLPVRSKPWSFAAAAVVCILIGAAAGWGLNEYGRKQPASPGDYAGAPSQVVEKYALKSFDAAMPAASGQCWIKQQGQDKQLIVEVQGLKQNAGDQAYQVWMVKQGTRFNGGTFRVDDKGNGVLTYDLKPLEGDFDTIGITLEPDAIGTKPRGKKVLGS